MLEHLEMIAYLMSQHFMYWKNLLREDKVDTATISFHLAL